MLLSLPERFDANEWFILLTTAAGYVIIALLPKRYPHAISVLLVLFCVSSAIAYDEALASPPLDLYQINDRYSYELMDVITYFMYSPYALLCIYGYDKLRPKRLWITAYIVLWAMLCVFFEWLAIQCHVFTFHHWRLMYSFAVYLVMTTIHLMLFEYLLRRLHVQTASVRSEIK